MFSAELNGANTLTADVAHATTIDQQVTLANLRLILNEQTPDPASANHAGLTVNALHLIASGVADITIDSAHAGVTCPPAGTPPTCTGDDFMTGSRSMTTSSGAKVNFAVAGGFTNSKFWGHVRGINHGNGKQKTTPRTMVSATPTANRSSPMTVRTTQGFLGNDRSHCSNASKPRTS